MAEGSGGSFGLVREAELLALAAWSSGAGEYSVAQAVFRFIRDDERSPWSDGECRVRAWNITRGVFAWDLEDAGVLS